jgi:hypothetical protein
MRRLIYVNKPEARMARLATEHMCILQHDLGCNMHAICSCDSHHINPLMMESE